MQQLPNGRRSKAGSSMRGTLQLAAATFGSLCLVRQSAGVHSEQQHCIVSNSPNDATGARGSPVFQHSSTTTVRAFCSHSLSQSGCQPSLCVLPSELCLSYDARVRSSAGQKHTIQHHTAPGSEAASCNTACSPGLGRSARSTLWTQRAMPSCRQLAMGRSSCSIHRLPPCSCSDSAATEAAAPCAAAVASLAAPVTVVPAQPRTPIQTPAVRAKAELQSQTATQSSSAARVANRMSFSSRDLAAHSSWSLIKGFSFP